MMKPERELMLKPNVAVGIEFIIIGILSLTAMMIPGAAAVAPLYGILIALVILSFTIGIMSLLFHKFKFPKNEYIKEITIRELILLLPKYKQKEILDMVKEEINHNVESMEIEAQYQECINVIKKSMMKGL